MRRLILVLFILSSGYTFASGSMKCKGSGIINVGKGSEGNQLLFGKKKSSKIILITDIESCEGYGCPIVKKDNWLYLDSVSKISIQGEEVESNTIKNGERFEISYNCFSQRSFGTIERLELSR